MSALDCQLTSDEARALTDRIKGTAEALWVLIFEAHERGAWKALGYPSFATYIKAECNVGSSHAYRLVDQGRVIRAIEQAAGSPVGEISERVARGIKPKLALVTAEIQGQIHAGTAPLEAVQNVINKERKPDYTGYSTARVPGPPRNGMQFARLAILRLEEIRDDDTERSEAFAQVGHWIDLRQAGEAPMMAVQNSVSEARNSFYLSTRKRQNRSNRIVAVMVEDAENITAATNLIDIDEIDEMCITEWAQSLRAAAHEITKFAARLEGRTRRRA